MSREEPEGTHGAVPEALALTSGSSQRRPAGFLAWGHYPEGLVQVWEGDLKEEDCSEQGAVSSRLHALRGRSHALSREPVAPRR